MADPDPSKKKKKKKEKTEIEDESIEQLIGTGLPKLPAIPTGDDIPVRKGRAKPVDSVSKDVVLEAVLAAESLDKMLKAIYKFEAEMNSAEAAPGLKTLWKENAFDARKELGQLANDLKKAGNAAEAYMDITALKLGDESRALPTADRLENLTGLHPAVTSIVDACQKAFPAYRELEILLRDPKNEYQKMLARHGMKLEVDYKIKVAPSDGVGCILDKDSMRLIGVYVNGIKALLNCMKEDQKHRRDSTIESLANLVVGKNVAAFSPLHKTIKKLAKIIGKDLKEIHVAWSLENEKKIAANDLAKAQKRVDEAAKKKKEEEESEKKRKKEEKAKGKKKKDDHS